MAHSVAFFCPGCHHHVSTITTKRKATTNEPHNVKNSNQKAPEVQSVILPRSEWAAHKCGREGCIFNPSTAAKLEAELDHGKIKMV